MELFSMIICQASNIPVIGLNACKLLIGTALDMSTIVTIQELDNLLIGRIHNIRGTQKKLTGILSGESNFQFQCMKSTLNFSSIFFDFYGS